MDPHAVPATANPSVTEEALVTQPIGYWSGALHRDVVHRLRDVLAGVDVTQPQWWVLNRVDLGDGLTREAVTVQLAEVAETPYDVPRAVGQLLHRGWVEADADRRLRLTEAGRAAQGRIRELVTGLRA